MGNGGRRQARLTLSLRKCEEFALGDQKAGAAPLNLGGTSLYKTYKTEAQSGCLHSHKLSIVI